MFLQSLFCSTMETSIEEVKNKHDIHLKSYSVTQNNYTIILTSDKIIILHLNFEVYKVF